MEGDGFLEAVDDTVAISIHTLRMEGDERLCLQQGKIQISIHTLRMEGDVSGTPPKAIDFDFNPHPPHGG